MPTINDRKNTYRQRAEEFGTEAEKYRRLVRNTNLARGVSFLGGAAVAIIAVNYSLAAMWAAIAVALVLFLYFVKKNSQYDALHIYNATMRRINADELNSLETNNYSAFDEGKEFVDSTHNFSYDLDIFGRNSIFQIVNRTCTAGGKKILAQRFQNPLTDIDEIRQAQRDSALFADEIQLRHQFRAYGEINGGTDGQIPDFSGVEYRFTSTPLWKIAAATLTTATVAAIMLACMDVCSGYVGLALYLVQMIVFAVNNSKTTQLVQILGNGSKNFAKYGELFHVIEQLKSHPGRFTQIAGGHIGDALRQLSKIAAAYEQRANLMVMIFGEGIICYDIWNNVRFENWLRRYSAEIPQWYSMAHEYDYLMSLANLRYNHPEWAEPQPVEGSFVLNAAAAGHPLIDPAKMVRNDINFSDCPFLTILTGANMAGKSTYLRTIGVNLVLAQIGAVVCAERFVFSPTAIMTSIRTSDSVQDNESYFFAELKRLQKIVSRLEHGETLFIIVDEMLRGTNSKDKHDGSQMFIQKLLKFNCYGIFATHDIDIGNLRDTYPKNVNAKCFEISFEGDRLVFDYTLKDGISQNLNASYLMRQMGIIG